MKAHLPKTFLVLCLALASSAAAHADAVFSEDFENPTAGAPDTTTPTPFTYSTSNGAIARASGLTTDEAYQGSQSLAFNFDGADYTANGSSEYDEYYDADTAVNLVAGDSVTMTFWARTDSTDPLSGGALGVFVVAGLENGSFVNQDLTFVGSGDVNADGWTEFTDTFTTTSAINDLHSTLKMATTGADGAGNLYLDNFDVSVAGPGTNVPEPATWALLIGSLGLLAGWRRLARCSKAVRG